MLDHCIPALKTMHSIKFNNIKQNEDVSQELILIKGAIIGEDPPKTIAINATNFTLVSSHFKALIELKEGDNNLIITCCCQSFELKLFYTPRASVDNKHVRPLYIKCQNHNGSFQAAKGQNNDANSALKRINTACKMLQCVLAEKLHELNFGRKSFIVESCEVFESALSHEKAQEMAQQELWEYFAREIMNSSFASNDVKFLAFLSCTEYCRELYSNELVSHEDLVGITRGYVALGGGGLALFGTACLYTWAEDVREIVERFEDDREVDKVKFLDDSAYRGTLGACYSTTLGSVLHELCHTFDLGHTDVGIMGRGFDDIRNIFLVNQDFMNKSMVSEPSSAGKSDEQVWIEVRNMESHSFIRNAHFSADVLNKPVLVDDVCFTKSSATILAYHKWFNSFDRRKGYVLSFDESLGLVKSTLGIRVVEVRRAMDEMVVLNWCFLGKILKYNFLVETASLDRGGYKMFVEDNFGNIIKVDYLKS